MPVSVKFLWDGIKVLWNEPRSGLVLFTLQTILGGVILYLLHTILESKSPKGKEIYDRQNTLLLGGSSHSSKRRKINLEEEEVSKDFGEIVKKLKAIVFDLFGHDSMVKAQGKLQSQNGSSEVLKWICKVVGVEEEASKQNSAMLAKIEEIEEVLGSNS